MVFGISSGAALAAEAARQLRGIRRLALYEAPYVIDDTHEPLPPTFIADTKALVAAAIAAARRSRSSCATSARRRSPCS